MGALVASPTLCLPPQMKGKFPISKHTAAGDGAARAQPEKREQGWRSGKEEEWWVGECGRTRLVFVHHSEYVVACTSDSHCGFFYALDVVGQSAESARSSWCACACACVCESSWLATAREGLTY